MKPVRLSTLAVSATLALATQINPLSLSEATASAAAQSVCREAFGLLSGSQGSAKLDPATAELLNSRYGVSAKSVQLTPNAQYPVIVKMETHESLTPKIDPATPAVRIAKKYDAVVVGGGPSGLTSALYLAEAGKSVLVLERNEKLGGLAMGDELKGVRAGGGAAYSVGPDGKFEESIFAKIGLKNYAKKLEIKEPIDSYLWNGKLYEGIWEEHTLEKLPQSFSLFKYALLRLEKMGAGGSQGALAEWADKLSMAQLVRKMPEVVAQWGDAEAKAVVEKFKADTHVDAKDPMKDVVDLLDLYGRSALGGKADKISGRQFIDFYSSEIYTRYTGTLGTGTITEAIVKKLKKFPNVEFRTSAPVGEIENREDGSLTSFVDNGVKTEVFARDIIFAAPVTLAPKLIKGLAEQDSEKLKVISKIEMTDYAVHVVRIKGHPYRATYDTWSKGLGGDQEPSDFILGRWQDKKINAYDGAREFQKELPDDYGVITIYQPLGTANPKNFANESYLSLVEKAVDEMKAKLGPLAQADKQKIEVELVESYRWPYSIHIVAPGSLPHAAILERPVGNIHFVNNTVAAPELEPSMARGASEALKIIERDQSKAGMSTR